MGSAGNSLYGKISPDSNVTNYFKIFRDSSGYDGSVIAGLSGNPFPAGGIRCPNDGGQKERTGVRD